MEGPMQKAGVDAFGEKREDRDAHAIADAHDWQGKKQHSDPFPRGTKQIMPGNQADDQDR